MNLLPLAQFSFFAETKGQLSGPVPWILVCAVAVFWVAVMWRIFTKAGQPGWACIIPFYNVYLIIKMAGKPGWWLLLLFIPVVDFVIGIIVIIALAERFGKGVGFAIGIMLLSIVFLPILAFGDAKYTPPPAAS